MLACRRLALLDTWHQPFRRHAAWEGSLPHWAPSDVKGGIGLPGGSTSPATKPAMRLLALIAVKPDRLPGIQRPSDVCLVCNRDRYGRHPAGYGGNRVHHPCTLLSRDPRSSYDWTRLEVDDSGIVFERPLRDLIGAGPRCGASHIERGNVYNA
jgi:hypothetical protein